MWRPRCGASDRDHRLVAGVPKEIVDEIDRLLAEGLTKAPIVMDAGYGRATELRRDLTASINVRYAAGRRFRS
ncbi:MAG TPA: transposase [Polyangia bacterium]|nr:transposase [Polyangia bacterium]